MPSLCHSGRRTPSGDQYQTLSRGKLLKFKRFFILECLMLSSMGRNRIPRYTFLNGSFETSTVL